MDFHIENCGNYFICRTSGDAEVEKFGDLLEALFFRDDWKPDMPFIVDHSDLNSAPLTADDVRRIAQISRDRRAQNRGGIKTAIVAPRDLEFGLARMWQAFGKDETDAIIRIFRVREEAIAWVTA